MSKYTYEQIETNIKNAIENSTPDMLEDLMAELDSGAFNSNTVAELPVTPSHRRRRRSWYKAFAGCAAAVLIFVGAFNMFGGKDEVCATVSIDVNPSIELSVNDNNKVVSAKAINEDGDKILNDMDLVGSDAKVACNAIIGSMVKNGYISELSNSMLVAVQSDDEAKGHEVEKVFAGNLNDSLSSSEISGAVLGQYIKSDAEIEDFAKVNNISQGKSWLIKQLMATGSKHMTEESLLQLSTQELILLSQDRDVATDDSFGQVNISQYISKEDAETIGLQHAELTRDQVQNLTAEFDCDDGLVVYEVEFTANGMEYEYDINAETGEIIEYEKDVDDGNDDLDEDYDDEDYDDDDDDDDD